MTDRSPEQMAEMFFEALLEVKTLMQMHLQELRAITDKVSSLTLASSENIDTVDTLKARMQTLSSTVDRIAAVVLTTH